MTTGIHLKSTECELKRMSATVFLVWTVTMTFPSLALEGFLRHEPRYPAPVAETKSLFFGPAAMDSSISKLITISGTFNGALRWIKNHDITDARSQSQSDLYIRKLEIGLESNFSSGASAIAVLNSEWLGDYVNPGDGKITLDEIHLDLKSQTLPFYLVFGQRTQPFGIFENHLITDPMTQDAYETKKVGLSLGYNGPWKSDFSVTLYKGREHINHLLASQLIDTTRFVHNQEEHDDLSSFIISGSLSSDNGNFTLFTSCISEPGGGANDISANLGLSLTAPFLKNLVYEAEWMEALRREKLSALNHAFKENILSMSLAYQFILRKSSLKSRGLYSSRIAYHRSHPLQIAVRYEHLDDDGLAQKLQSWSVKDKMSIGGHFSFMEVNRRIVSIGVEIRNTRYRYHPSLEKKMHHGNQEVYAKLGIDF
jgi:hypothetical protein